MKNKKGSLLDVILIGAVLLVFSFLSIFGYYFSSQFSRAIGNYTGNSSDTTQAVTNAYQITEIFPTVFDNMFLFFAIFLSIGSLILASLVRVHPIYLVFFIIGLIFTIVFSAVFSNAYQEFESNPILSPYANRMIFTTNIMELLPYITAIFGVLIMIVSYKIGDE